MYCSKCGYNLQDFDSKCPACGKRVKRVKNAEPYMDIGMRPQRKLWPIPLALVGILLLALAVKQGLIAGDSRGLPSSKPSSPKLITVTAVPRTPALPKTAGATPTTISSDKLITVTAVSPSPAAGDAKDTAVVFADSAVEAWIREYRNKQTVSITIRDMENITVFRAESNKYGQLKTLSDLRLCRNLKILSIYNQPIDSVEGLSDLPYLNEIWLQRCNISDFSPLDGKQSIKIVQISDNPVSDASPILRMPNLRVFAATGTQITDISELRQRGGLKEFYFSGKLKDYSPLYMHKGLSRLELTGLSDKDFVAILDNLKNLEDIRFYSSTMKESSLELLQDYNLGCLVLPGCGIKDLSALSSLNTLIYLGMEGNGIEDISKLSGLTQLVVLDLRNNNIKDYTPLQNFKNLKELRIDGNPETSAAVLDELVKNGCKVSGYTAYQQKPAVTTTVPAIRTPAPTQTDVTLASEEAARKAMGSYTDSTVVVFADSTVEAWIRENYVKKTGGITVGDMKNMTDFVYDAINNKKASGKITTLFDLRYCANLAYLTVTNQPITSIESLRGLTKLCMVDIFRCNVADLSPLQGKAFLVDVWVSGNPVTDASPVLALPSLTAFNAMWGTKITDISALRNTENLEKFFCQNELKDYTPLFGHKGLKYLSLKGLTNETFVAMLGKLKNLNNLSLQSSSIKDASLALLRSYSLNSLNLDSCGVKDISALSSLNTLTDLRLPNNAIEDISPLSGLTEIGYCLDLHGNNIKDFSPLKNMKNLKSLWVTVGAATHAEVLDELEKGGCEVYKN